MEEERKQHLLENDLQISSLVSKITDFRLRLFEISQLERMGNHLRWLSVKMTTTAGSGHPSSCLSMADILSVLFFDEMHWNPADCSAAQDIFVLSKGHAAPILWAALHEAGAISDDLLSLRKIDSVLEGHPTFRVPWVRVATGSLGQGLSAAAGMCLAKRMKGEEHRVYCVVGDGETMEGAIWEAAAFSAHYKLSNLCCIVDVNRLGQSAETMYQHDLSGYSARFAAFGWHTIEVDGHNIEQLQSAFKQARTVADKPTAIVARTLKGKGIELWVDKMGFHGKPVPTDALEEVQKQLGGGNTAVSGSLPVKLPVQAEETSSGKFQVEASKTVSIDVNDYKQGEGGQQKVATRAAYGAALVKVMGESSAVVALDGEVRGSTFASTAFSQFPARCVECFIAEQNMVGVGLGMCSEGLVPCVSTFACFFSRALDFVRMAGYSLFQRKQKLVLVGSHGGVNVGEDGPSQMGLEDIAMMRPIFGCSVVCPSDAVSTQKLLACAVNHHGITYLRTSRPAVPVLYDNSHPFCIGGSTTLRSSPNDRAAIVACGVCVHTALAVHARLQQEGVSVRVIDCYSVKPIDEAAIRQAVADTAGRVITVEDHSVYGGLGSAVAEVAGGGVRILGVSHPPRSGSPAQLMQLAGIDAEAVYNTVKASLQ